MTFKKQSTFLFGSFVFLLSLIVCQIHTNSLQAELPNIVVILTDDQGYADVSYNPHSPKEVSTPHIDALASESVVCTQGYTTGHVCSPTRAGLITGRYQQRFGVYTAGEGGSGVPLSEKFFPEYLKQAGYVSGAFGKWHLGLTPKYNAINRGFDEFYGFMGRGAHDYFDLDNTEDPIYRGLTPIKDEGYLTNRITEEAVSFIDQHKADRFFMYVAYNAVHAPPQAPEKDIKNLTGDETRDTLMAMLLHLDNGIGQIVDKLKAEKLFDNTLLIFLTDNGGSSAMHANNAPLRGFKQHDLEGGVRVPFIVSWPEKLKGIKKCDVPVTSIDILPTAIAAAGVSADKKHPLDGKNMLPALEGKTKQLHENIYWSSGSANGKWAIRAGDLKLVAVKDQIELFDLSKDISEANNLAAKQPEQVKRLTELHDTWLAEMAEPNSNQTKRWTADNEAPKKKKNKNKKPKKTAAIQTLQTPPSELFTSASKNSPNVLLIVCDDLNNHVTPSGYSNILTPSMQRLADSGLRFTKTYCQYPVCGPSRSSFLSGLYPESSRVVDNKSDIRDVRPNTMSLPQWFKEHGYWTGGVGKIFHNSKTDPGEIAWNENHRFDNEWNPVLRPLQLKFEKQHGSIELPKNQKAWKAASKDLRKLAGGQTPPGYGPTTMTDEQHKDGKNAKQIAQWLDNKSYGNKPFFLVCGIHKPHVPYWAPQKYFDMYPTEKLKPAKNPADDWQDIPKQALVHRYKEFGFEPAIENDALSREYMQAYHACITFVDAQIGKVLDAVERNELDDNTIIVLTSDHGYHLGEHYLWGKVTLFEVCAKVPLVIRAPGVTQPKTHTQGLTELVDLFPTLCELTGLPTPEEIQGKSLTPLLKDPSLPGKQVAYTVVSRGPQLGRSIRIGQWRYAEWSTPDENELYHLSEDPNEFTNLAKDPEHKQIVARLRNALNKQKATAASLRRN